MHEVAARPNKQWSLRVDFFCQNGFESYKFTQGKRWLTYAVLGVAWNITHCSIGQLSWRHRQNFRPMNFPPNRYESPLKWHNQPGKKVKELESLLCKTCKLCKVFIFFFLNGYLNWFISWSIKSAWNFPFYYLKMSILYKITCTTLKPDGLTAL